MLFLRINVKVLCLCLRILIRKASDFAKQTSFENMSFTADGKKGREWKEVGRKLISDSKSIQVSNWTADKHSKHVYSVSARDTVLILHILSPGSRLPILQGQLCRHLQLSFLPCILNSFTSSLKIHFYTDLFLDEATLTKIKLASVAARHILIYTAIQILTCLKPGQVDTIKVSITEHNDQLHLPPHHYPLDRWISERDAI